MTAKSAAAAAGAALPATADARNWRGRLRRVFDALWRPQVSSAARERRDIFVLLLAVALAIAPHLEHLPLWASAVIVALWCWRTTLNVTQQPLPARLLILPLLLATAAAVWLQHRTLFGRDAGVTFLLMLLALKLMEMRVRRDIFVVVFLSFFVLLTQFLFGQELPVALLTLLTVLLLFFVLVSVNLTDSDLAAGRKFRLVGAIALQALPLTIALFVLFPRISGPLWGVPGTGASSHTGLSNTMAPGSFARLLQSDEVVLRVQFAATTPGPESLYWRGPTLGSFNGRAWRELPERDAGAPPVVRVDPTSGVRYTVTLEPNERDWLLALEMPELVTGAGPLVTRMSADGQVLASSLISERIRYSARSYTRFTFGTEESPATLRSWLQLPAGFNPRTLQFAADLRQRVAGTRVASTDQLVRAVLEHFHRDGFVYTLEPPGLGRDSVDEFLFGTRQGYCEHYASAFVVVMRALAIPARVVTGYQGGEINPVDGVFTVRQADAHAWAEVWTAERGWLRVDPTAAVATVRSARGVAQATAENSNEPLLLVGERALDWLRHVRFNWEAVQNAWNQWVLSYSAERQRALLERLGFDPDWRTLAALLAAALGIVLTALAVFTLRVRERRDPLAMLYAHFCQRLEKVGVRVAAHTGPRALNAQLQRELEAEHATIAQQILSAFEQWRYSRASAHPHQRRLRDLRRAVRAFRPQPRP